MRFLDRRARFVIGPFRRLRWRGFWLVAMHSLNLWLAAPVATRIER
jgi:hypothetical protein